MEKKFVVTIGREFGSGGRQIATGIGERVRRRTVRQGLAQAIGGSAQPDDRGDRQILETYIQRNRYEEME